MYQFIKDLITGLYFEVFKKHLVVDDYLVVGYYIFGIICIIIIIIEYMFFK